MECFRLSLSPEDIIERLTVFERSALSNSHLYNYYEQDRMINKYNNTVLITLLSAKILLRGNSHQYTELDLLGQVCCPLRLHCLDE